MTLSFRLKEGKRERGPLKPNINTCGKMDMFTCSTEHLDFSSLALVLPFMITNQKLWEKKSKNY